MGITKEQMGLGEALAAKKEAEEKYKILFESSRDAIMTLEPPKWNFTSCNPATIKLFGATDEKHFLSTVPWQLSPKKQPDGQDSPSKAKKMIELAMKNGSNFFEWTHKRFNGEEFLATVLLSRMNINEKNMLQATVRDISEMKNISWELKKSKDEMANIIELNPYSIQICDAEGHHIHANKAFEQLFGAIPPEGYSVFEDPVVKKSGIDKYISQLKKGKPIKIPAFWYDPHDADPAAPNKKVCISITAFPIFDSTGKITNVVLMHETVIKE
jgi:PAS domain S-box-containing protein